MEDQDFREDGRLQREYRGVIRNRLGLHFWQGLEPPYTKEELAIIAGTPDYLCGMYSKNQVYNAFRAAGLDHSEALKETKNRFWL